MKTSHRRLRICTSARGILLASSVLFVPSAAFAQDASVPAPQIGNEQDNGDGMGDIVVTAQRREERLQDVPAAITAFTGDTVEKLNLRDTSDIARVSPSLRLDNTAFAPQPTLRGIGSRSISPGEESTVPIFIDGVYLPFPTGNVFQLQNIERIEVLKGPQGALYGRNATGGAINIVTSDPEPGVDGKLDISYGRFGDFRAKGLIEGGTETFGASLSAAYRKSDGYLYDILTRDSAGGVDSFSIRGKIVAKPTDTLTLRLAGSHEYLQDLTANAFQALDGNTAAAQLTPTPVIATGRYQVSLGGPVNFENRIDSVSLTANLDLGSVAVTALTSYIELDYALENFSNAAVQIPRVYNGFSYVDGKATYNEFYVQSQNDSKFSWLVGGTYYHVRTGYDPLSIYIQNVQTLNYLNVGNNNYVKSDAFAGYAQANYEFNDQINLTVAGRYTNEKTNLFRRGYFVGAVPGPGIPLGRQTLPDAENSETFDNFSPSATLQYKFNERANVYAKFAKGFKSGVFSPGGSSLNAAEPELVTQYEIGAKVELMRNLRFNLAVYRTNYNDIQVQSRDPMTNLSILQNASNATINGGEAELIFSPSRHFDITAGLAITDGKYKDFKGAVNYYPATDNEPTPSTACTPGMGTPIGGTRQVFCDVDGNRITRAPVYQANLNGYYETLLPDGSNLGFSASAAYESHYYWDSLNRLRSPARTLIDAEISLTPVDTGVTISIWGKNLLDEFYYRHINTGSIADTAVPAEPVTYGLRVRADF